MIIYLPFIASLLFVLVNLPNTYLQNMFINKLEIKKEINKEKEKVKKIVEKNNNYKKLSINEFKREVESYYKVVCIKKEAELRKENDGKIEKEIAEKILIDEKNIGDISYKIEPFKFDENYDEYGTSICYQREYIK